MGSNSIEICPRGGQYCAKWAIQYLNYCICSAKDGVSLGLGLVSVVTWSVAEIPQIITNYKQKSTEGLSVAFLATWIIGDIFNLVGCLMEPATLPTQYYMALLYTLITLVLVVQSVHYKYIYPRLKQKDPRSSHNVDVIEDDYYNVCNKNDTVMAGDQILNAPPQLTDYAPNMSFERDLYHMSARCLFKSSTPSLGSFLAQRMASFKSSSQTRSSLLDPLLAPQESEERESASWVKPLLYVVSAMSFLGALSLHFSVPSQDQKAGFVIRVGRRLLEHGVGEGNGIATLLGWGMAAIYMGGRLPQILLNMRKGNVEGLNPLMFFFALVGNGTYVASILVNSLDWSLLRPNLPWLVDAGGCVLLDFIILLQLFYFRYLKTKTEEDNDRCSNAV